MVPGTPIPGWLLWGLALGGGFAILALAAFVAGGRLFPDRTRDGSGERVEGGQARRRDEIREYLTGIDEYFVEDREIAGHVVEFYLPGRDVVVTFDAKAYLDLQDSPVEPVLCEHEMPGSHLGARLPFDTPGPDPTDRTDDGPRWADGSFADRWRSRRAYWEGDPGDRAPGDVGGSSRPDRETVRESFAALGLSPDASGDEVRAAYRERIKDVHPDQGGDRESFRRIQDAYATARDHAD